MSAQAAERKPLRINHVGQAYLEALEAAGRTDEAGRLAKAVQTRHKPRRGPRTKAANNGKPVKAPHADVMAAMARMAKASGVAA